MGRRLGSIVASVVVIAGVVAIGPDPSAADPVITRFHDPSYQAPFDMVAGADGNLWVARGATRPLGRVAPDGTITNFPGVFGSRIASGADGNLYVLDGATIRRVTTAGAATAFTDPDGELEAGGDLTTTLDGFVWFTSPPNDLLGRFDPSTGAFATFTDPSGTVDDPRDIVTGMDGNAWFISAGNQRIGRITPLGEITTFPSELSSPRDLVAGPDGQQWYRQGSGVRRITSAGVVSRVDTQFWFTDTVHEMSAGPDGNVWLMAYGNQRPDEPIGAMTPQGRTRSWDLNQGGPGGIVAPSALAPGGDGNLWASSSIINVGGYYHRVQPDSPGVTVSLTGESSVLAGEPIHYVATITNTTAATLSGLRLTLPLSPACQEQVPDPLPDLAPGAEIELACTTPTVFPERIGLRSWHVVVSSTNASVMSNDVVTDVTAHPGLDVTLAAEETEVVAGSPMHYEVTATNTGDVPLTDVVVQDSVVADCEQPLPDLPPGGEESVECEHVASITDADVFTNLVRVDTTGTAGIDSNPVGVDVVAPPHGFVDVPPGRWYGDGLDWAAASGLVSGFPGDEYRPKDPVKRSQVVSILWHLADAPGDSPPHGFVDVAPGAWYGPALDWARAEQLVSGFSGNRYLPARSLNRAQAVSMLWNLVGRPLGSPPAGFGDVPADAWYGLALDWAAEHGLVTGFPGNQFRPKESVNRGQLANMVFQLAGDEQAWTEWAGPDLTTWRFQ